MYRLRVLGAIELEGPEGERVSSVLSQPKRLALLVLLAVEGPERIQRDDLLGRLWPELPQERARKALRQALYYLRRSLGPGVVEGAGSEGIGVVEGKLWCDAAALRRAASEGRHEDVLELYRGELLPGFHLDDSPAPFEQWLVEARRRLRAHTAESAWMVAERREAAGNAVGAGAAARRAWELREWSEPALRDLLSLLLRNGDRAGAERAFEEFADRLRREHGRAPSAETRRLMEDTHDGSGPADAAPHATSHESLVSSGPEPSGAESTGVPERLPAEPLGVRPVPGTAARRSRNRVRWLIAAALAGVLVVITSLLPSPDLRGADADARPDLYLGSVRDLRPAAGEAELAEALTSELAGRLGAVEGLRVVVEGGSPAGSGGLELRPSLRRIGGALELSVLLLDASSDAVLDRLSIQVEADEERAAELLAGRMAPRIRTSVGDIRSSRLLDAPGISSATLDAIRAASAELAEASRLRGQGAFEAAAVALAAADSLLQRAERLSPGWPEPTLRRAENVVEAVWLHLFAPQSGPGDAHRVLRSGIEHAERAVDMAPADGRSWQARGWLRYWLAATAETADTKEAFTTAAERDLLEAVRLDPALPRAWSLLSAISERRGDFAAAYYRARRAYQADYDLRVPSDILARLFTNALEVADAEGARSWCEEIHRRAPGAWLGTYCDLSLHAWAGPWAVAVSDSLRREGVRRVRERQPGRSDVEERFQLLHGVVLARAGEEAEARRVLAETGAAATPGREKPEVVELRAWIHTLLGERERAERMLSALSESDPVLANQLFHSRRFSDLASYLVVRSGEP